MAGHDLRDQREGRCPQAHDGTRIHTANRCDGQSIHQSGRCATPLGVLTVSLHANMSTARHQLGTLVETAILDVDGRSHFHPQDPQDVHIACQPQWPTVTFAIERCTICEADDDAIDLVVVVSSADQDAAASTDTLVLLAWREAGAVAIGLQLSFDMANSTHCDVWSGRPECGGVQWHGMSSSPMEVIAMPAAHATYGIYANLAERRCDGYRLPSSPTIPGGSLEEIDCFGDCATGRVLLLIRRWTVLRPMHSVGHGCVGGRLFGCWAGARWTAAVPERASSNSTCTRSHRGFYNRGVW